MKNDASHEPSPYYEVFEKTQGGESTRESAHLPDPNQESDWEQEVLDVLNKINRNDATQYFMDLMAGLDPKDCERNKVFFQRLPPAPTEPEPPEEP